MGIKNVKGLKAKVAVKKIKGDYRIPVQIF